jgi:histidine triad (HIT) family protein
MAKPADFDFYCQEALTGKTKIKKIYESDKVLAFYHTKPQFKTHIVIVPKEHFHDLSHAPKDIIIEITEVAKRVASKIEIEKDGVRFGTNLGKFQDTPHLHFHLISDGKYPNIKIS